MFALEYQDPVTDERIYKAADEWDLELYRSVYQEFEDLKGELIYPRDLIPTEGRSDKRPISLGYRYYHQLFNPRQLLCLSLIYAEIIKIKDVNTRDFLLLAFSDCLANNNWFCSYAFGYRKLTPLFGLHAYRAINRPVEANVWGTTFGRGSFVNCFNKLVKGKRFARNTYEFKYNKDGSAEKVETGDSAEMLITPAKDIQDLENVKCIIENGDARNISWIPSQTIDLVFTDPPYYDNLPYSELSDFYYVWLRDYLPSERMWKEKNTPYKESLFVPKLTEEHKKLYEEGLVLAFKECRRVLKPNGLMVFTYHHRDLQAWTSIGRALQEADLVVTNIFPILSEGRSGFHSSSGNIKWDAVFCCRPSEYKPVKVFYLGQMNRWVTSRLQYWITRFEKKDLNFGNCDSNSLQFALVVAYITRTSVDPMKVSEILEEYFSRYSNLGQRKYSKKQKVKKRD